MDEIVIDETEKEPKEPSEFKKALDAATAEAETRVDELSAKHKCEVFAIILPSKQSGDKPEFILGYARKPDLITQLKLIDKSSDTKAGISIEACHHAMLSLILNESDERILDKKDTDYWKGACISLSQYLGYVMPLLKKK